METFVFPLVTGIFTGFQGEPGIGQQRAIGENNSELFPPLTQLVVHLGYVMPLESFRKQNALGRRLGMELIADPEILNVVDFF